MNTATISSSLGTLTVNKETGEVTHTLQTSVDANFGNIIRIDVEEYKKKYQVQEIPDEIDILDLGYWIKRTTTYNSLHSNKILSLSRELYEAPCEDWREEVALLRKQG